MISNKFEILSKLKVCSPLAFEDSRILQIIFEIISFMFENEVPTNGVIKVLLNYCRLRTLTLITGE